MNNFILTPISLLIIPLSFLFSACSHGGFGHLEESAYLVLQDRDILSGTPSKHIIVAESAQIILSGPVFIKDGLSITIQQGATIFADVNAYSYLVIQQGGQIFVNGSRQKPVTFTSQNIEGRRYAGDWGGIIINGSATINAGDILTESENSDSTNEEQITKETESATQTEIDSTVENNTEITSETTIETVIRAEAEAEIASIAENTSDTEPEMATEAELEAEEKTTQELTPLATEYVVKSIEGIAKSGFFGGEDNSNNSGQIEYLRIYFSGRRYNNKINMAALTLQGVGFKTSIGHVQIHNCLGNGISVYGGTVNLRHILLTNNYGYQLHSSMGWRGKVQYLIASPTLNVGYGLYHENNENKPNAWPATKVDYYNATIIKPSFSDQQIMSAQIYGDQSAIIIRHGAEVTITNSLVSGLSNDNNLAGITDDIGLLTSCFSFDNNTNIVSVQSTYLNLCGEDNIQSQTSAFMQWQGNISNNSIPESILSLLPFTNRNNIGQLTESDYSINPLTGIENLYPLNGFFNSTNYSGAIQSAEANWTQLWTAFPVN